MRHSNGEYQISVNSGPNSRPITRGHVLSRGKVDWWIELLNLESNIEANIEAESDIFKWLGELLLMFYTIFTQVRLKIVIWVYAIRGSHYWASTRLRYHSSENCREDKPPVGTPIRQSLVSVNQMAFHPIADYSTFRQIHMIEGESGIRIPTVVELSNKMQKFIFNLNF